MFIVLGSTSTKIIFAPRRAKALAVLTKVYDGIITSSPGCKSINKADISKAAVHEGTKKGFELLKGDSAKSFSFAVTSFAFPIQRAISIKQGNVAPMFPQDIVKRSQDLEEAYHDAGQFYWGRTDDYLTSKKIFSQHSVPIVLPRHLVQDIDTPEDWHRAELMYQAYVRGMQND